MNEICFASIDPLALRALPLEGEEIPELSVITLDDCIFLPCQGRCRPCFAEAATRRRRQRQRGFACRVKFSLGEMPRSGRGVNAFLSTLVNDSVYLDFVITACR